MYYMSSVGYIVSKYGTWPIPYLFYHCSKIINFIVVALTF